MISDYWISVTLIDQIIIMSAQGEFWVKNMVCSRCLKVIKQELEELHVTVLFLELGKLVVKTGETTDPDVNKKITEVLSANGFEIVQGEEEMPVDLV